MDAALAAMLTETVGHAAYTGQDSYGKPMHAGVVNRPARIQYQVTTLTNAAGQERTSTTTVYFDGNFTLTVRDLLILPDGTRPAIQQVYSPRDPFNGTIIDHHKVML
jgi:hypothetical protein